MHKEYVVFLVFRHYFDIVLFLEYADNKRKTITTREIQILWKTRQYKWHNIFKYAMYENNGWQITSVCITAYKNYVEWSLSKNTDMALNIEVAPASNGVTKSRFVSV